MKSFGVLSLICFMYSLSAQTRSGKVCYPSGEGVSFAIVQVFPSKQIITADVDGYFKIVVAPSTSITLHVQALGTYSRELVYVDPPKFFKIVLEPVNGTLKEVVVTGTMREISKDDSPINIDVITPKLFQKTSTVNLFEATSLVNGVKPQINCNVCNTGDIHINGMEGPYTLILIDGMPIVSGLSSVYGLMGIPASMIERLEIAKGPAGALYGSEAMGGTINLITKNPRTAPKFYADYFTSSYLENNLDLSLNQKIGKNIRLLSGLNGFWFQNGVDLNHDQFTDVTLQKRLSFFNKLIFDRKDEKETSVAVRFVAEDRWGGELNWNKGFRGGDSIYGENISIKRVELLSKYEWPTKEKIITQVSYNLHDQDAAYGRVPFIARQSTAFVQTFWDKAINSRNNFLAGINFKNLWYDDNTVVTYAADSSANAPDVSNTLGMFVQNETAFDSLAKFKLLSGIRLDYNSVYRFVPSPRLALKWTPSYRFTARLNMATGFRIVNVFTEDHAALTGARTVIFTEKIKPERSYNASLNMVYKMKLSQGKMLTWDFSVFYYQFLNKIYANYDQDPKLVVYRNLDGYAYSRGASLNLILINIGAFKMTSGFTFSDVKNISRNTSGIYEALEQLNTTKWSGNVIAGYEFAKQKIQLDLTANWYGPQRLAVQINDFRPEYSPWFCLLNFQANKKIRKNTQGYIGVKNLLNFLPSNPLMRPQDPFNKQVNDPVTNPNNYVFDTAYNYAPLQGIRLYLGFRMSIY